MLRFLFVILLINSTQISAKTAQKVEKKAQEISEIAIVDLKQIATESKAGQLIEDKIKAINNEAKKGLIELEDKIKAMETTKEHYQDDSIEIEKLQIALYDMVRTKRYAISMAYRKAIEELEEKIKLNIKSIAMKKNIKLILASDAIIYNSSDSYNMTKDVIEMLNKQDINIKVEL